MQLLTVETIFLSTVLKPKGLFERKNENRILINFLWNIEKIVHSIVFNTNTIPLSFTMFSNAEVKNLVFMGSLKIPDPSPVIEIRSWGRFSPQCLIRRDETIFKEVVVPSRTYLKEN